MMIQSDARHIPLADESVHCVVTSPPYWGLRDYGSQLGLEATPEEYVAHMVEVFCEVRRVLRRDGTLWLVLGDSYTSGDRDTRDPGKAHLHPTFENWPKGQRAKTPNGLKPKDLVGIPWRTAFALQADGWWLRSEIVWSKPNPMPESVTDRPTKAHESVFLLAKSATYYYDAEAIAEPAVMKPQQRLTPRNGKEQGYPPHRRPEGGTDPISRNRRSVWEIATQSYAGCHFATYPEALVQPCIAAGTSEHGCCPKCGAPWERLVTVERTFESGSGRAGHLPIGKNGSKLQGGGETLDIRRGPVTHTETTGWQPTCRHNEPPVPCIVFDPFSGSGTTGLVAFQMGRRFILSDLKYHDLMLERIPPMAFITGWNTPRRNREQQA